MQDQPRRSLFAVWHWRWWKILLILLMFVPFEYFAAYLLLLQGRGGVPISTDENGQVAELMFPIYRTKSLPIHFHWMRRRLNHVLAPAHQIDRRLRPDYWEPWGHVDIPRDAITRK